MNVEMNQNVEIPHMPIKYNSNLGFRVLLDLDCNNVKPRLDNENGWISMRNDF